MSEGGCRRSPFNVGELKVLFDLVVNAYNNNGCEYVRRTISGKNIEEGSEEWDEKKKDEFYDELIEKLLDLKIDGSKKFKDLLDLKE